MTTWHLIKIYLIKWHSSNNPNRRQDGVQAPYTQPDQRYGQHGCKCHFISARQTRQIVDSFGTQNVWH